MEKRARARARDHVILSPAGGLVKQTTRSHLRERDERLERALLHHREVVGLVRRQIRQHHQCVPLRVEVVTQRQIEHGGQSAVYDDLHLCVRVVGHVAQANAREPPAVDLVVACELERGLQPAAPRDDGARFHVGCEVAQRHDGVPLAVHVRRRAQFDERRRRVRLDHCNHVRGRARDVVQSKRRRALHLEPVVVRHVDQRPQAACLHDGHAVLPVGREIAQREAGVAVALGILGAREADEWREPALLHDVLLVRLLVGEIRERHRRVALAQVAVRVEQLDEWLQTVELHHLGLVVLVRADVAKSHRDETLHFVVGRAAELDEGDEAARVHDARLIRDARREAVHRARGELLAAGEFGAHQLDERWEHA